MSVQRVVIAGGGAAGFFAAIQCAQAIPHAEVLLIEKGPRFLSKIRISGGGRCNVTHACFDVSELVTRYPRGGQCLHSLFHKFQPQDTIAWFESRGVKLKTESDGRIFPVTDTSQTIIDCLMDEARKSGVKLLANRGLERISRASGGGFELVLGNGDQLAGDRLLLATGGCRVPAAGHLAVSLGHTLVPPVPSLFTFHIDTPWLHELSGIAVDPVEASLPGVRLRERGAMLATHWGLSGPVILRLSAWGARTLHELDYQFPLHINWLPHLAPDAISTELSARRRTQPGRLVINTPLGGLPARLWEQLARAAGLGSDMRWAHLSRFAQHALTQQLIHTTFSVSGKSLNKDEFVTCGGVRLGEINLKTMESRICPGLFFAGELLDIDGLTGGYNFQAAWTTGWIAGRALPA